MRKAPWLLPLILLILLAATSAHAQRTMTIVSSDPADSSIAAETVEESFHGNSWIAFSPLPMLIGFPSMHFPPYGRVIYYREMSHLLDLGAGMELSMKGTDPGIYTAARFHGSRLYSSWSLGGYLSYRTFGENGDLWTLGLAAWYDVTIAGKVLISTGLGFELFKGTHNHDFQLIERPEPDDALSIGLTLELGYML